MCELEGGDGERCEVYSSTWRKARKAHRCYACGTAIAPGTRYFYGSGIYDGSAFTEKVCEACENDRNEFGQEHGIEPSPGEFASALRECIEWDAASKTRWMPVLERLRARREAAKGARA